MTDEADGTINKYYLLVFPIFIFIFRDQPPDDEKR